MPKDDAPKSAPVEPAPAAGWYDHPRMADTVRYWDGAKWTDNIAPKGSVTNRGSSDDQTALVVIGLIGAIVFPFLGFIIGIVLMAKNKAGAGVACVLLSVIAFYVWYALLSAPSYEYDPGY